MRRSLSAIFRDKVVHLMDGNIPAVVALYRFPAAVYYRDGICVFQTSHQLLRQLRRYRKALLADGITRIESRVVALSIPLGPRRSVWVENRYFAGQTPVGRATIRYFLEVAATGPTISLVDYAQEPHAWADALLEPVSARVVRRCGM